MGLWQRIRNSGVAKGLYIIRWPLAGIPIYYVVLTSVEEPEKVLEARARKRALLRGDISKEEYKNPNLLKRRRQLEEQKEGELSRWIELQKAEEADLAQMAQQDEAQKVARKALKKLKQAASQQPANVKEAAAVLPLPAINLLGQISVEMGEIEEAQRLFTEAVALDPEGDLPESMGGGAEKYLWLAQLSEEGGKDSVRWFQRGAEVLRNVISHVLDEQGEATQGNANGSAKLDNEEAEDNDDFNTILHEQRKKLSGALCSIIEVYMTDLSWETDAESVCERLIAEALLVDPESPETLQTLANIRISQGKKDEAKRALTASLKLWSGEEADAEGKTCETPDFASRISLSRLLMEVEMKEQALAVVERLIQEEDQSVEAWYLGGWCLYLLGQNKSQDGRSTDTNGIQADDDRLSALRASHQWLQHSLALYDTLEYEDERLQSHAQELLAELVDELGEQVNEDDEEEYIEHGNEDDNEWQGLDNKHEEYHDDAEMTGT